MKLYETPILEGELGNMRFLLNDGTYTKVFYNAGELDDENGQFPILNKEGEVVEYMDLIGNFSKGHTKFAKCFYCYCNSIIDVPFIRIGRATMMYTGLSDFPSRYLVDEKVIKVIKLEEKRRFKYSCKNHKFDSLMEMLKYKLYVNKCMKEKLERAKYYKQTQEDLKIQSQEIDIDSNKQRD